MSQHPPAAPEPPGRDELPSWAGAPGFTPYRDTEMPHAPMPGAPPYPPDLAPPPPQIRPEATTDPGTGLVRALLAAGVWAMIGLALVLVVDGVPAAGDLGRFGIALVVPTVLTALVVRIVGSARAWSFWTLLLVAAPFFWVLRALQNVVLG